MPSSASIKDDIEYSEKFVEFYDYSYWKYKIKTLTLAMEDSDFIKKVARKFPVGGDPNKIRRALSSEIYFTCLHTIESLFFLIGGFTHSPKNPFEWINNPEQHVNGIAKVCKKKKFHILYEKLGLNNLDDYISYLFYPISPEDKTKSEVSTSIKGVPELLHLLAKEFFSKKEIYNTYKHGLLIFPGSLTLTMGDPDGTITPLFDSIPTLMVLPKDEKKKSKFLPQSDKLEYPSDLMSKMDYYGLNYPRQLKIFRLTMFLIRNLIQTRREMIKRRDGGMILTLPPIEEIRRVFEDPPLFTIVEE